MPLNFISHNGNKYPDFQSLGGASLWIRPLAQYYCKGNGLDIGYSKEAWMLPNAIGIEPSIDPQWDAMKLPQGEFDYIHSSHCLEHVNRNVYDVLDYWLSKIKVGGILFLYLPHSSQSYWHPSSNRKHIHSFNGSEIEMYLNDLGHKVWVSGCDFNHSFVVVCEKVDKSCSGVVVGDISNEVIKSKDKYNGRSFTRVTPENQSQFGDIPLWHYVHNSVGETATLPHQNMNETVMKGMYYTYFKTPMPDCLVPEYNEGCLEKENDTPLTHYRHMADKAGVYWADKCKAL